MPPAGAETRKPDQVSVGREAAQVLGDLAGAPLVFLSRAAGGTPGHLMGALPSLPEDEPQASPGAGEGARQPPWLPPFTHR